MVLGAITFTEFVEMLGPVTAGSEQRDPVTARMRTMPTTVVSTTLRDPLPWPNATLVSGEAVEVVARPKEDSEVPLRSHGSLSMNCALMAAGLVDRIQVSLFPVITGRTGAAPILGCPTGATQLRRGAHRRQRATRHPPMMIPNPKYAARRSRRA